MTISASCNRRGTTGDAYVFLRGAARRGWRVVAAMTTAAALGCGAKSAPTGDGKPAVSPSRNVDAEVLLYLDPYDPMYKLNAQGRVINLRMGGRQLSTPVMAEIGKLTELRGIDLYGALITDDGLAQLKDLQKLSGMGLGATPITDEGLDHLAKLKGLRNIFLPKSDKITKAGVEKLKNTLLQLNVYY